uniref:Uncharacterized protein n=1 Tax=Arundo donax TaxID=35708 RepID=A0A0A9AG78_ARUDO
MSAMSSTPKGCRTAARRLLPELRQAPAHADFLRQWVSGHALASTAL